MMVFPARAGMNRGTLSYSGISTGVPRACGDEPRDPQLFRYIYRCSPRVRG